jgi:hypothetical protein
MVNGTATHPVPSDMASGRCLGHAMGMRLSCRRFRVCSVCRARAGARSSLPVHGGACCPSSIRETVLRPAGLHQEGGEAGGGGGAAGRAAGARSAGGPAGIRQGPAGKARGPRQSLPGAPPSVLCCAVVRDFRGRHARRASPRCAATRRTMCCCAVTVTDAPGPAGGLWPGKTEKKVLRASRVCKSHSQPLKTVALFCLPWGVAARPCGAGHPWRRFRTALRIRGMGLSCSSHLAG